MRSFVLLILATTALAGCNLAPDYARPAAPIPATWPTGPAYSKANAEAVKLNWETLFADPKLNTIIRRSMVESRDLRIALANVRAARAQYGVQRAGELPVIGTSFTATYQGGEAATQDRSFDFNVGLSNFEIDLFGRLANLSESAFQDYLATEAGARSTQITLVSEIATAYATYAYDSELLQIARETVDSASRSFRLTQSLNAAGLVQKLDVTQAETILRQAESDVAQATTQIAQDRNALNLLVGAPVEDALLPKSLADLDRRIGNPPAGLSSQILLQRPDVQAAEFQLKGAYADIGAARAAFFPTISLTAAYGAVSPQLSSLFNGGNWSWNASPSISLPIFNPAAGSNLEATEAQRDALLATYEQSIQSAFREVADALARAGTIDAQREAQRRLLAASQEAFRLSDARYRAGVDPFLTTLTSQRTLYTARQSEAATVYADIANRITLYRALSGGTARTSASGSASSGS